MQIIETSEEYDVLVCGGGTAGTIAAIQAARAGIKTVLIENGGQLGGTTTTGGVSFPGLYHANGKQIIKGIGWELVEETVKMNSDVFQDFTKPSRHWENQITLNPYLYSLIVEEKCIEAGVQLRYYETPVSATFDGSNWVVDVVGKGTKVKFYCKQLIDCTGNALLAQIAGYDVLHSEECQPGTFMFKLAGYDLEKLNMELIQQEYQKALQDSKFEEKEFFKDIARVLNTAYYKNKAALYTNHIHGADSTTSKTHTITNINGRNMLIRMLRFLRTLPGLENTTIYSMATETSIRETYRIDGLHVVTINEYINAKRYEDGICNAFYPVDLHDKAGVKPQQLNNGLVPSIPLGALIPKNSQNFIVAGRCVSSDQMANSALRVQGPCMAMGQAAGAAAALAAKQGLTPQELPITQIHKLLCEYGAIIPTT